MSALKLTNWSAEIVCACGAENGADIRLRRLRMSKRKTISNAGVAKLPSARDIAVVIAAVRSDWSADGGRPYHCLVPDGETTLENLALCRYRCNEFKRARAEGIDAVTRKTVPLYHPAVWRNILYGVMMALAHRLENG